MNNFSKKIDTMVFNILNEEIEKKSNEIVNILEKELKGGQKKLDVAKPKGKLTSDDFKMLRGMKKKETKEGKEACEQCGGGMYEGMCSECGYTSMREEWNEEEDMETDKPKKDGGMFDSFISHLTHHDKPGKMSDFFKEGPMVDYIKNKKNKIFGKKETNKEVEEGNAFSGALNKARKQHKDSFEVDGETYPVREAKENWIQKAKMNKGALHKKLGIPEEDKIPVGKLKSLKKELQAKGEGDKKMSAADLKLLKQVNLALNLKSLKEDSNTLKLTEEEMINLLESIVVEEKEKQKLDVKVKDTISKLKDNISKKYVPGMSKTQKSLDSSKKEENDYISSVTKKMKEYLKDGSKSSYEMNPTYFPKGNGELAKMEKMAYEADKSTEEYIENFTAAGMENLVYDEIHPDEEWITDNIEGSSRTGNNPEWANSVETNVNKKRNQIRKDNLLGAVKAMAYNKAPQPVIDDAKKGVEGKFSKNFGKDAGKKATKILNQLESTDNKNAKLISEEFNKMKNLMNYNKKTQ